MRDLLPVRDLLETAIFGTDAEAAQFEATDACALRVYGLHHRADLLLSFTPIPSGSIFGVDRELDWASADDLLFSVRDEADKPGGFRYVVYPDGAYAPGGDWIRACDFGPQEAANVFAKAAANEAQRAERLAPKLKHTTRPVAFGGNHAVSKD